jgi:tetratricopeptide (TPR) repeat protein
VSFSREVHSRWYDWHGQCWLAAIALARGDGAPLEGLVEQGMDAWFVRALRIAQAEQAGDIQDALSLLDGMFLPVFLGGAKRATRARLLLQRGEIEAARVALDEAIATPEEPTYFPNRLIVLTELDEALPALGDDQMLAGAFTELAAFAHLRLDWLTLRSLDRIRGALALRLGRVDEAETLFRTAAVWTERERCPVEHGRSLQGLAAVAVDRGRVDDARTYLDRAAALFEQHGALLYSTQLMSTRATLST